MARAWRRPTRPRWPRPAGAGRARPHLGSMEQLQNPHREGEGTTRMEQAAIGPAPPRAARHLELGPAIGPALRPGPAARATGGFPTAPSTRPAWHSFRATAYRSRRRMQRMTASGTIPSTERPSQSSARTSELETATWGPSTQTDPPTRGNSRPRAGRPGHDGQGHQRRRSSARCQDAELGHQVGPDHQEELGRLAARFRQDLLGGVHRVAGSAPIHLEPARLGPGDLLGQELGQRVAVLRRRDGPLSRLLPGIVGHDEEEAVEVQLLRDGARRGHVPVVRRVEGAPEDPDPGRALRCRQVRRSPAPARPSPPRARRCS